ncbi:MAG: hypothetical protein EP338_03030 [Bacteroidetes bacterium]|nr:MAG: hypothetical protein EP338_03030 [Bacteroidota bacterium]
MNQLQKSLGINALFSGLSGIVLIAFNRSIADLFDVSNTTVFWGIGAALLFFTLTLVYEVKRQKPSGVLLIILQDFIWVVASTVLLIFQSVEISKIGSAVIGVVALLVLFMAINQTKALAQVDNQGIGEIKQLRFERAVNADKKHVWKIISDVAAYHTVAPNIDDVKIISGDGVGMVRACSHGKDQWTETCSLWREEKEYAFEVNTNAPDYPYPFKYLKGTWEMEEIDASQTRVIMFFEFEYRKKFHNYLLHPLLRGKFSRTAEELLDNWQEKMGENNDQKPPAVSR